MKQAPCKPNSEEFASSSAASTSATLCTTTTGPNASSRMRRACGGAFATIAGPRMAPRRSGSSTSLAPLATASLTMASTRSAAALLTIGPTSMAVSSGSPTLSFLAAATNNSRKRSNTGRSTITRCAEMHCWPLASNAAPAMRVAASLRSASAQTMFAALDPSSPMNFFAPAARASSLPAAVLPVTVTTATSGWAARSFAVSRPPGTTLKSPSGTPAVFTACAISNATSVPGGDGLTTTALPTASAGATF